MILSLIAKHSNTLSFKDFDDRTAIDICLKDSDVSDEVIFAILSRSLPYRLDEKTGEIFAVDAELHMYSWTKVVQADSRAAVVGSEIMTHYYMSC
jgi:hypothetical protein